MTINFTSGLIRCGNTYYNPDGIQKFNSTHDGKTQLFFIGEEGSLSVDTDANTFADAFVEAQLEGNIANAERKINYFG